MLGKGYLPGTSLLAGLLSTNGDGKRADELLRSLGDGQAHGAPCALAIYHFIRSEIEQGARWTEKAIEQQDSLVAMLLLTPPYSRMLRSSSCWPKLARMMNLAEAG